MPRLNSLNLNLRDWNYCWRNERAINPLCSRIKDLPRRQAKWSKRRNWVPHSTELCLLTGRPGLLKSRSFWVSAQNTSLSFAIWNCLPSEDLLIWGSENRVNETENEHLPRGTCRLFKRTCFLNCTIIEKPWWTSNRFWRLFEHCYQGRTSWLWM